MSQDTNRDLSIDILKGIGIMLVVVGHAGCPQLMRAFIYSFHMPLFFIASGYFFGTKDLEAPKHFFFRKIKRVYVPFVKWSLFFLLLHNVFFCIGIINDQYGNAFGDVSSLYSIKEICFRAFNIITRMCDYEMFILGAFWFMRALFVGSVLFCFLSWLMKKKIPNIEFAIGITILITFCFGGILSAMNYSIPHYPQGGFRDFMAASFIGCGFFLRKFNKQINFKVSLLFFLFSIVCVIVLPAKMSITSTIENWITIIFSGISGTIVFFYLSKKIACLHHWMSYFFAYVGKRSFYILTLHFLMFKPAALLYTYIYHLDWKAIGSHPIILPIENNWYWIIYTITAIALSLVIEKVVDCLYNIVLIKKSR